MKLHVIVVRDTAADVYGQPQFVPSVGAAVRSFGDEVNRADANNALYNHPEDFILFDVGVYDDNTCVFDLHEPRQIARASDYKR